MGFRKSRFLLAGVLVAAAPWAPAASWEPLFDGATLDGWRVEREGEFTVEDGTIVGRQGPKHLPGDLFTTRAWANFELELEWRVDGPAESGIWFRRTTMKTGYQADLNDGKRPDGILSGSLWCYGKGYLAVHRDRRNVAQDGWNLLRIRALGDEITIEQNGRVVARVRDSAYKSGRIGIQIPDGKLRAGMAIYVRNVRIRGLTAMPQPARMIPTFSP